MSIYPEPTKTLMLEFAGENLAPGKVFSKKEAIDWFVKKYPKLKSTTIDMHVNGMSINNKLRKHHRSIKPGSGHDLFYKLGPNQFRLWDKEHDGEPHYAGVKRPLEEDLDNPLIENDQNVEASTTTELGAKEFALEADLRNYIVRNLAVVESGLVLYEDEGLTGIEYPADGRRIDVLCLDRNGKFVVIELKVSRGYDRVVGQILRYMAWVKMNLADGEVVRGIIVASEITADLKMAASLIANVSLVEYEISFLLKPVS